MYKQCVLGIYIMIRTQIFLTETEVKKLELEAQEKQLCKSEIIRRILDSYFDNKNNENKKSI